MKPLETHKKHLSRAGMLMLATLLNSVIGIAILWVATSFMNVSPIIAAYFMTSINAGTNYLFTQYIVPPTPEEK